MTRLVILDTTCLYTFCRHSKHNRLQDYLGSVARITLEVRDEVAKKAGEVPRLADLLDGPVWPEWVELNPSQQEELFEIAKSERRVMGGFSKQDLGEIATVIRARDSRSSAIVDDGLARDLARRWSVAYSRTHSVVTAMVKAAHLSKAEAWAVWQDCWTHPDRRSSTRHASSQTVKGAVGHTFENVCLTFEQGRITNATGTPQDKLTTHLDTDEGARYLGEFALGVNPFITFPMRDILYDENIAGSLHLTPGDAYAEANNGNKSAIHWDLVLIQTPQWGGGEIWLDGVLVRRDGLLRNSS